MRSIWAGSLSFLVGAWVAGAQAQNIQRSGAGFQPAFPTPSSAPMTSGPAVSLGRPMASPSSPVYPTAAPRLQPASYDAFPGTPPGLIVRAKSADSAQPMPVGPLQRGPALLEVPQGTAEQVPSGAPLQKGPPLQESVD